MLPLKAGSLTQSSPPVRSLEGMQDRLTTSDHLFTVTGIWSASFVSCCFHLLRSYGIQICFWDCPWRYPSISSQAAGVWPGICQIHGSQRGNATVFDVRVGDSRPKRSEKCLVDSILNSWPIISFVVTAVLLYQVRFWVPCHFDRAYCYILLFLWFRAEVLFEFTVEVTQERDMIEQWKKPDALVYIRELYYPVKYEDWGFNKPL